MLKIDDLDLFYGGDIDCSIFKVKNPTINEIIEYGKVNNIKDMSKIYELGIQLFTAHPYDYMVMLDDMKIDFEEFDKFDLFKLLYRHKVSIDNNDAFLDHFFNFIFNEKYTFRLFVEGDNFVIIDAEKKIEITKEIHNGLFDLFSMLHGLNDRTHDILFGQQILKKLYIKKAKKRLLKESKKKRNQRGLLSSKILPIIKLSDGAVTMDNIFNLNMYTMTELLEVGIQKDSYDNVMFGIYTGNVDSKSVDQKIFNWSNTH